MAALRRLWLLAALMAPICGAAGCNLLQVPFFLFGPEPSKEPELKRLAREDKDKEVKVVVFVENGDRELRSEFVGVERELASRFAKQLHDLCQYNKEKVAIVPTNKVERFKQDHPSWHQMDKTEIGKYFEADYVIWLDVGSLTLYKKNSNSTLFQGKAEISISLVDVNEPEDGKESTEFICIYPSEAKGGIDVNDTNPLQFRQMFLTYLAKKLAWHFTSHPTQAEHECE